jgi:hypothetical protein
MTAGARVAGGVRSCDTTGFIPEVDGALVLGVAFDVLGACGTGSGIFLTSPGLAALGSEVWSFVVPGMLLGATAFV